MRGVNFMVLFMVVVGLPLGLAAMRAGTVEASERSGAKKAELPFAGMRVAILTGEGFQDAEALMPMAYLSNRGANVTVVGVEPGKIRAYNSDIALYVHKSAGEVKAEEFDMLILPGGKAPAEIRKDESVLKFSRAFYELGKPVAAICHGPQVLISAGVVKGHKMTCVSSVADEVREAGATYHDEEVLRDGNLITSRVPKDIPAWLGEIETLLMETRQ
jgi:protease I